MFIEIPEYAKATVKDKIKHYVPKYLPYFFVFVAGIIVCGLLLAF
jgi:hypothetical protein